MVGDVRGVAEVTAAVARVVVAVELHNLVLRGGDPTGPELIANNAIHAGVVRSPGIEPPPAGTVVDSRAGVRRRACRCVVGSPLADDVLSALPWLVRELARHGHRLEVGQLVLAGAWGPPRPLRRVVPAEGGGSLAGGAEPHPASDATGRSPSRAKGTSGRRRGDSPLRDARPAEATFTGRPSPRERAASGRRSWRAYCLS